MHGAVEDPGPSGPGRALAGTALLVLLAALGLRLAYLGAPLADRDSRGEAVESINYFIARNTFWYGLGATRGLQVRNHQEASPEQWRYYNNHPATFTILQGLSFMVAGGPGMIASRALPFLAFLVQLLLLYRLARRRSTPRGGLVAVALYSLFPMTMLFAHHANYEAYVLVAMLLFVDRVQERRWGQAVLATFLGGLVDFVGCFPAVLFAPWLLLRGPRGWGVSRGRALALGCILALTCLVVLAVHFLHVAIAPGGSGFIAYLKGVAQAKDDFARSLHFTWSAFATSQCHFLLTGYGIAGLVLAGLGLLRRQAAPGTGLLLATGLFYITLFRYHAHVHEFWGLYLAPGLALAGAGFLAGGPPSFLRGRRPAWGLVVVLLLAAAAGEGLGRTALHRAGVDYGRPERWARSLQRIFPPGETLVVLTGLDYPPFWGVECHTRQLAVRASSLVGPADLRMLAGHLEHFSLGPRRVVAVVSKAEADRAGSEVFGQFIVFMARPVLQSTYLGLRQPSPAGEKGELPSFHAWDITRAVKAF